MAFVDSTVVNVALPALQASLRATVVDVQWVIEAYGLLLGSLILVGGALGDLFGRRRMFLAGVIVFAFASLACGLAQDVRQLIIARAVQGFGAAFLTPGSLAIIAASFDERTRGQAIGTWSGFSAITSAAGPVLGGWLIEHASWRLVFFINLPLAAAVVAISLRHVPESRSHEAGKIDGLGAILTVIGLGGLVFGFVDSAVLGWTHPAIVASFVVGAASLLLFVVVEWSVPSPLVPMKLFRSRTFAGANLFTLLLYAAPSILFFLFPLNLIQVQGYSATATGAATLPIVLLMFLLSRWAGGLVARYGARRPMMIGPTLAAAGFALLSVPGTHARYWIAFFPALLVLGLGMATTVAPLTTTVMNSVPRDHAGTASGINNAVARVAGVMSIAVFGVVMLRVFGSHLDAGLASLRLSPELLDAIRAQAIKLAALEIPPGLEASTSAAVRDVIGRAFVAGFRTISLICSALCLASAAIALLTISDAPATAESSA
jgi:EmrB/QacA subfamily drug resistance transporter